MADDSHLDQKYFIDSRVYNCPFCNRNNVEYKVGSGISFNWSTENECYIYFVKCSSCGNKSMHLSYDNIVYSSHPGSYRFVQDEGEDIDSKIFYSVPTSFFTIDSRIPKVIRELITEAEGCLKMNFLTGASACTRKAIYELIVKEEAEGEDYESRIKYLKGIYPNVDSELFDVLCHIKDMTSEKVHEQSWDKWDSKHLTIIIETLKTILHEVYVVPDERKERSSRIRSLLKDVKGKEEVEEEEQQNEN